MNGNKLTADHVVLRSEEMWWYAASPSTLKWKTAWCRRTDRIL